MADAATSEVLSILRFNFKTRSDGMNELNPLTVAGSPDPIAWSRIGIENWKSEFESPATVGAPGVETLAGPPATVVATVAGPPATGNATNAVAGPGVDGVAIANCQIFKNLSGSEPPSIRTGPPL